MRKIALVTTHPIQYYAPWFALLAKEKNIELKVFYTFSQRQTDLFDNQFEKKIEWDIPLLEGYNYEFVLNTSSKPNLGNFGGVKCPDLIEKIEAWEATHILIFGWNYHAHLSVMRYFKGKIQVWFRGDSTLLNEKNGLKLILRRLFLKWVYSYVDCAFYVGTNNKKYFEVHGLKENQLMFAPHAIDNIRFQNNSENNYELKAIKWREELGISKNDKVIIFAGKFEKEKNPLLLLKAFNAISLSQNQDEVKKNDLKLIFIGNGTLEKELKQEAKNNINVLFLPFQNQTVMPILYRLCDIFCLPSTNETWGLAINEAMACGRAIIVSDKVGCANDLIIDKVNGFIFEANNLNGLISTIKEIYDIDKISKMGTNSQRIIKDWSFKEITESIINRSLK